MVNPEEDILAFNKKEKVLMVLGSLYAVMCGVILFIIARKNDNPSYSPRFMYAFFMVAAVFSRALGCFIGVGEVQNANENDTLVPFLIFEVPNMLVLVAALALAGAQYRNVKACAKLRNKNLISDQVAVEPASSINRDSSREPFLGESARGMKNFCVPSTKFCLPSLFSISVFIYGVCFLLCAAYFAFTVVLSAKISSGEKRNSMEQAFLASVNSIALVILIITTSLEYCSGCLNLRQHRISVLMMVFLCFYVVWAGVLRKKGKANEFENPYYLFAIEYGIEFLLFVLFFRGLKKVLHGPCNVCDPVYLNKLFPHPKETSDSRPENGTTIFTIRMRGHSERDTSNCRVSVKNLEELKEVLSERTRGNFEGDVVFASDSSGPVLTVENFV